MRVERLWFPDCSAEESGLTGSQVVQLMEGEENGSHAFQLMRVEILIPSMFSW